MKFPVISHAVLAASAALVVATAFTARQSFRLMAATEELTAARLEKARTRLMRPAPVTAPAQLAASAKAEAPAVSPSFAARLEQLKSRAVGRAPGGVPLINPEDLFDYHVPLRQAYLEAQRGRQWVDYGAFFANAGLTSGEIEQFHAIAMERELAWLEFRKLHPGPNQDNNGVEAPEAREMNERANRDKEAKLTALLGEKRFEQFKHYEAELPSRTMLLGLRNLVATTFYTDEPVTAAQVNQLAALATEYGMFSPAKANGITNAFEQLAVKSARILSPRQLDVFDLMLDHQQYALAMWQLRFADQANQPK